MKSIFHCLLCLCTSQTLLIQEIEKLHGQFQVSMVALVGLIKCHYDSMKVHVRPIYQPLITLTKSLVCV